MPARFTPICFVWVHVLLMACILVSNTISISDDARVG